jgi:hypothetical protein
LSDAKVYAPSIRALLGTASHFCEALVLKLRTVAKFDFNTTVSVQEVSKSQSETPPAVERTGNQKASQGQILALAQAIRLPKIL